ncbi:putative methionine aminopeptidase 1D, partial [Triplophysa rosa]
MNNNLALPQILSLIISKSLACEKLNTRYLNNCYMYVSLQPCMMCIGAIKECNLDMVYYAALNNKSTSIIEPNINYYHKEAEEDILALGGIQDEESITDKVLKVSQSRLIWLMTNLFTAIINFVKVGTNTNQLDELCHNLVLANGAIPAPLNYHGFPKSICTSINHEVCHGIPSKNKTLKNGDIVNIDVSVNLDSWYGDSSRTYVVGKIGPAAKRLVKVAEETMWEGIKQVRPGNYTGDIGLYEYTGHGIGKNFHEDPNILNF